MSDRRGLLALRPLPRDHIRMILAAPSPAQASPTGGVYIASFTIVMSSDTGHVWLLHAHYQSEHRVVDWDKANYGIGTSAVGLLPGAAYNWRIDFQCYNADENNKLYRTEPGSRVPQIMDVR
jgi:hypothetical protein